MRIAVVSDIHGNLEAWSAVLADIRARDVDEIYCLGDVVGYGADPSACLRSVNGTCTLKVRGNHEEALFQPGLLDYMRGAAAQAIRWTKQQLVPAELAILASWPLSAAGSGARLVHGSPAAPARFSYVIRLPDAANAFGHFFEHLCFCGHSHIPLVAEETVPGVQRMLPVGQTNLDPKRRYIINVGSVGQPRDGDPTARWVLVQDQPRQIMFNHVAYDIAAAQQKIRDAGLPEELAIRLNYGE